MFGRDARPVVAARSRRASGRPVRVCARASVISTRLPAHRIERVLYQIFQRADHFVAVAEHGQSSDRCRDLDLHIAIARQRLQSVRNLTHDRARSSAVLGCRWALSSMRDSDKRSSISRAMRVACPRMMARNFSRATVSSLAGPCKVSMKPSSAAKGVRSSWLALAMKSARIFLDPA